jgi:hypothetical protein
MDVAEVGRQILDFYPLAAFVRYPAYRKFAGWTGDRQRKAAYVKILRVVFERPLEFSTNRIGLC